MHVKKKKIVHSVLLVKKTHIIAPISTKYFVNFWASILPFQRAEERNQSMYDVFIVLPAKASRDVEGASSIMESSLAQRI